MYSSLYLGESDLSGLKLGRNWGVNSDSSVRPIAVACGPVIGHGQVWEPLHRGSIEAGLAKNHASQITSGLRADVYELAKHHAWLEFTGKYDALSVPASQYSLMSDGEVLDWVHDKDPSRGARYQRDYLDYVLSKFGTYTYDLVTKLKVKVEILKLGKPPRVIHDLDPGETVLAHAWAIPFENFIKTRLSWKGLRTTDKWVPFATATAYFGGDCFIICLDDVARDCNTQGHDFYALAYLLSYLGIDMQREGHLRRLFRAGAYLITVIGGVTSPVWRLLSGASYTSGMNWNTSRFLWTHLRTRLGIRRRDIIVVAEGDDNFAVIRGSVARSLRLDSILSESRVSSLGREVGKVLKIEKLGWFGPDTWWPAVGGRSVYSHDKWAFLPDQGRAFIKAGWAISHDFASFTALAGRITARSWALNERFDRVPVFWAYARVVAAYSAHLGAPPLFDSDESRKRDELGWDGGLACAPDDIVRHMYFVAYGVGVGDQLILEDLLFSAMRDGDYTRDLTLEFRDIACRE